jgi:hypothetical protein
MTSDDFTENLRGRLADEGKAAEGLVERLEHDRASGAFGTISTVIHASVIAQYRKSAEQLLRVVPGDSAALAAVEHAKGLTTRITRTNVG